MGPTGQDRSSYAHEVLGAEHVARSKHRLPQAGNEGRCLLLPEVRQLTLYIEE